VTGRNAPEIVLVGTLDTKGREIEYTRGALQRLGCLVTVVDSGILGEPDGCAADVTREELTRLMAGGAELDQLAHELERRTP